MRIKENIQTNKLLNFSKNNLVFSFNLFLRAHAQHIKHKHFSNCFFVHSTHNHNTYRNT